jgi:hypothetical protein
MKLKFILLLAHGLTSLTCIVTAQIPTFSVGPKIGYNTTKLTTDISSITSELKSNFQFGAFVRLGNKVYIQPEINYVTKGGLLNGDSLPGYPFTQEVELKTLTFPILAGVRIIDLKAATIHLVAGPVATLILDKKLSISNPGTSWPIKSADDFKTASWSLQFGAGVDVLIFTLDLRYEVGLSNLYNGNSDLSVKNNLFNVSLGLKLF